MGPAKLPANPALELSLKSPSKLNPNGVRLANVAVIQPGDRDVYRLNSNVDKRSTPTNLGQINTPIKR